MISRKSALALGMLLLFARATLAAGVTSAPQRYVFDRMDLATSSQPVSVVTGDFNGDGKPDIAVIHQNSASICVFLAYPDSTFGPCLSTTITSTATIGPSSLVAADFNGDGKLDLAFVNGNSTVGVLLGNGDGTFAAEMDFAVPSGAVSLATGDLNGDGKSDLVVGAQGGLAAYLGNGNGTFSNSWNLAHTCNSPTVCVQVLLGDFNGDGKLDLALTFPGAGSSPDVVVDLGNGDGTFQNFFVATSTNHQASGTAVADLNGDGKLDLVTADLDGSVSVLLGNGDGSFAVTSYFVGKACAPCDVPTSVVAADFNGDGKPDVAVSYSAVDPSGILVFINGGGGALGTPVKYPAGLNSYALAIADFNQDGLTDLVVANERSSSLSILIGDFGGAFLSKTPLPLPSQGTSVAVGDFNGDGLTDLAVSSTSLSAFLANPDGSFHPSYNFSFGPALTATVVGDFNNDGKQDVMLNFSTAVGVFLGNGDGTLTPQPADSRVGGTAGLAVGDFNGDAKIDRAIVNTAGNSVSIQLGNGDGTFQPPVSYATALNPTSIVVGDFNKDGKLDLAVVNNGSGTVSILLSNGDGTFQPHQDYGPIGTAALTSSLVAADFNGDGNLDLAVATNTTKIGILLGKGDGTFQTGQLYSVGTHVPSLVAAGDFDADGKIDLAVGFSGVDNFVLLDGNGDGTFQSPELNFLGFSTQGAVALAAGKFGSAGGLGLAELFQPIGAPQPSNSVYVFLNKPVISLFPASLVFQPQQIGVTSPVQIITVYNPSSAPLIVSRTDKTGDFAETDTCTSAPVVPGGNCIITGSFTPTASGLRTGTFILTTNAGAGRQVINLSSTRESTATSLTSSVNPSVYGQSITLTASVTPSQGGTAAGTVTFTDGGSPIGNGTLSSGNATLITASLLAGSHSLQATYAANGGLLGSSSPVLTQTVNQGSTTIVVSCGSSGLGPPLPILIGERILCGGVVTPVSPATGVPTRTATLYDGGTPINTAQLSSIVRNGGVTVSFSAAFSTAGPHSITAQYAGDANFLGSTTSSPSTVQIAQLSTSLGVLASSTNPSVAGSSVTFTVPLSVQMPQIAADLPQISGAVTFSDGSNVLGSTPVGPSTPIVNGIISISFTALLGPGTHLISASYSGDNNFTSSTSASPLSQVVNKASIAVTLLGSGSNTLLAGLPQMFVARVGGAGTGGSSGPQPTGNVTIFDGSNPVATLPLGNAGPPTAATLTTSALVAGSHSLTAQYNGDGNYLVSTSAALLITISKSLSTVTLSSSTSNSSVAGQQETFSALVGQATTQNALGSPTGSVTFFDGSNSLGSMPLGNPPQPNFVNLTTSTLAAGLHTITAQYGGDPNYLPSTSAALQITIVKTSTTVIVSSSATNSLLFGQPQTFSAQISLILNTGTGGGPIIVPVPVGGSVTFYDAATALGTGPVGTVQPNFASFMTSALAAGPHTITAQYNGDPNYNGSTSAPIQLTITNPATTTSLTASPNPAVYGQALTFTSTVTSGGSTPGGQVTFFDGATSLGTGTLSPTGVAMLTTSLLGAGTHSITASYAPNGNFLASASSPTMETVNPAPLTITANNATRFYGAANPAAFPASFSGFVNNENRSVLTGLLTCGTTAMSNSPVGMYPIACLGLSSPNYAISFINGMLTVVPEATSLSVTISPSSIIVGQSAIVTVTLTAPDMVIPIPNDSSVLAPLTITSPIVSDMFSNNGICTPIPSALAGTATCSVTLTPVEPNGRTLVATFPGTTNLVASTSANNSSNTGNLIVTAPLESKVSCIKSNFRNVAVPGGSYLWFNSIFKIEDAQKQKINITFFQSSIQFQYRDASNSLVTVNQAVPDARITFDPSATTASTTFDAVKNVWLTTSPFDLDDRVFLTGIPWLVPAGGIPGDIEPVSWCGTFASDTAGVEMGWRWAAAAYSSFSADASVLGNKPMDSDHDNPASNHDRAGTPENFKAFVIPGARGKGGKNYTGTYSGTAGIE